MNAFEGDSLDVKRWTKDVGGEKLECASVTWKISNFSRRAQEADEKIRSQEFLCSGAYYELRVFPNGRRVFNSVGKIGLFLKRTRCIKEQHVVALNLKFTIPYKRVKNICYEIQRTFTPDINSRGCANVVCRNKMLRSDKRYLVGDVLTIKCDLSISLKNISEVSSEGAAKIFTDKSKTSSLECASKSLSSDFEVLYESGQFSDVTLKLDGEEFKAHKFVLSARSKVFAAMFEHDMKENRQDVVHLVQMKIETVRDMLRYVYCGKIRDLSPEEALNLYVAADRYDLPELKNFCREVLLDVSVNNVCDIVEVADLHDDKLLMKQLKPFLSENGNEIIKTEKWKNICNSNPMLCGKMFELIFSE